MAYRFDPTEFEFFCLVPLKTKPRYRPRTEWPSYGEVDWRLRGHSAGGRRCPDDWISCSFLFPPLIFLKEVLSLLSQNSWDNLLIKSLFSSLSFFSFALEEIEDLYLKWNCQVDLKYKLVELLWPSKTLVFQGLSNQWGAISPRWQYWSQIKSWTVLAESNFFGRISKQSSLSFGTSIAIWRWWLPINKDKVSVLLLMDQRMYDE